MEECAKCKCGGTPEIYTRFPISKQMYKGEVICPDCGEQVLGAQWQWNADDAAQDAVEEWNKMMKERMS